MSGANWRDPRLVLGVAIVAASVLLGVRLLGAADETSSVWAVRADLSAGAAVTMADVERQRVRFGSAEVADRYLSAETPLPDRAVAVRALGAGELLPRDALGSAGVTKLTEVPLAAAAERVPATVGAGVLVDVWVTPTASNGDVPVQSTLVFDDVIVVAAPRVSDAWGPSSDRPIVVGLDDADLSGLPKALARLATGDVVITRQG